MSYLRFSRREIFKLLAASPLLLPIESDFIGFRQALQEAKSASASGVGDSGIDLRFTAGV